jgi:hypothetical protein
VCVPFGGIPVKDDTVPPALEVNYETLKSRWVLATLGNSAGATFIFFGLVILLFVFTTSLHHIATLLMYRRMGKGRWLPA